MVEILVAVALFAIVASASTIAILGAYGTQRLAKNEARATQIAQEGLEAFDAIRLENWDTITDGAYGLSNAGGTWTLSGSSDVDESGIFTRILNVVTTTTDQKTVSVVVTWNQSPTRSNQVQFEKVFTNWQVSQGGATGGTGPTPTPSPSPGINTCAQYCVSVAYSTGTCRANVNQCNGNGETNEAAGNTYCTGGGGADTCCCAP